MPWRGVVFLALVAGLAAYILIMVAYAAPSRGSPRPRYAAIGAAAAVAAAVALVGKRWRPRA